MVEVEELNRPYLGRRQTAMRALRYKRPDVTEDAIAEELGVTRSAVSNWMCGHRRWPERLTRVLIDELKVEPAQVRRAMHQAELSRAQLRAWHAAEE